jgi:hypothetical protein
LVNQTGGSTGITIGSAVTGGAANAVLYEDASQNIAVDGTNFLYTTTSGPRLQVGSGGTTSAGFVMGYYGTSTYSAIWSTVVTPANGNYSFITNGSNRTQLAAPSATGVIEFTRNTVAVAVLGGTAVNTGVAGAGLYLTAGTATTAVNATSVTQTWNNSGITFTGNLTNITNTASAAASLIEDWQVGGVSQMNFGIGSGPRLQIGSGSSTSSGIILGYWGISGQGAFWSTNVTPSTTNHVMRFTSTVSEMNTGASGQLIFTIAGIAKMQQASAAGQGLALTAGTATTDVAALSLTRTNNNAAVATGVKIAYTDTTSAAGFLPLQILGGASATTNLLSLSKTGDVVAGATVNTAGYTVGTLPAGTIGMTAYVTDATAPTFLGALVGSGSTVTPVFYNGAAWVAG